MNLKEISKHITDSLDRINKLQEDIQYIKENKEEIRGYYEDILKENSKPYEDIIEPDYLYEYLSKAVVEDLIVQKEKEIFVLKGNLEITISKI